MKPYLEKPFTKKELGVSPEFKSQYPPPKKE
jgi:hypothetical protein